MSAYKRFLFVKNFYPNYLVFIIKNKEKITFDDDLKIVNEIGKNNITKYMINYLILDNTEIVVKNDFVDNRYLYYYKMVLVMDIIKFARINSIII